MSEKRSFIERLRWWFNRDRVMLDDYVEMYRTLEEMYRTLDRELDEVWSMYLREADRNEELQEEIERLKNES